MTEQPVAENGSLRVALITGASRGLGEVVASFLAGEGYALVLTARGETALRGTAERLRRFQSEIEAVAGDVTDSAHLAQLRHAAARLGTLRIVVNNASDLGPSPLPPISRLPIPSLRRVLEVNLLAPVSLIQETLPLLRISGGLIVNISSDAALVGYPGWGAYGSSKAGLDLLSLTLSHELKGSNIGVVSVDPGDMRTAMHQAAFPGEDISDRPTPDVTLPFWAWLFGQNPSRVSGARYRAQADRWEIAE